MFAAFRVFVFAVSRVCAFAVSRVCAFAVSRVCGFAVSRVFVFAAFRVFAFAAFRVFAFAVFRVAASSRFSASNTAVCWLNVAFRVNVASYASRARAARATVAMEERRWAPKLSEGMMVMHFKTGRTGTVVKFVDEERIQIAFDKYNAAGIPDGRVEVRRLAAFRPVGAV